MIFLFESLRELFCYRSVLSSNFMKLCLGGTNAHEEAG